MELCALVGCFAALAGIVSLLAAFDGKSVFEWNGVTLNAIISILAVSMKAFLLFSVAECVGQWKWIVFSRGKRMLMDFELIDMASRGPMGALSLVWRKETPWMLRLGVLVILLTLALDPFSQQLVKLEQGVKIADDYEGTKATSPRTEEYSHGRIDHFEDHSTEDTDGAMNMTVSTKIQLTMETAILNGLSGSTEALQQQVDLRCPSSNCTWPVFETLGVCYRCSDLTADLRRVDNFGDFANAGSSSESYTKESFTAHTLPNGHVIVNLNGRPAYAESLSDSWEWKSPKEGTIYVPGFKMTSFGTGNPKKTNLMKDIDTLIWSTSVIYTDDDEIRRLTDKSSDGSESTHGEYEPWEVWPTSPVRAEECAWYYCVKSVNSSVHGNIIHEDILERTDAVRNPESWQVTSKNISEAYPPENIPKDNDTLYSLEFHEKYSVISMELLRLYFPDDSSKPQYRIAQQAVNSISAFFQQLLADGEIMDKKSSEVADELLDMEDAAVYNGIARTPDFVPYDIGTIWSDPDSDVEETFKRVSISMTNEMRNNGGRLSAGEVWRLHENRTIEPVEGHITVHETLYRSEWYWIALHGALTLGGCVFCIFTVIYSARESKYVPPWKTSTLPVMSNGYATARALRGTQTLREMEKRARNEVVSMQLMEKEATDLRQSVSEGSDDEEVR